MPVLETIFTPGGTVQLYPVAPATEAMLYVTPLVRHNPVYGPEIPPGCAGIERIVNDREYVPQTLVVVIERTAVVKEGPKLKLALVPLWEATVTSPLSTCQL